MLGFVFVLGFAVLITILYFLLLWVTNPSYGADEPQPIPHSIPILGHAISFAFGGRRIMESNSSRSNCKPHSLLIAGQKYYFFESLNDITTIFHHNRTLDIAPFVRRLYLYLFGLTVQEAEAMYQARPLIRDTMAKYLLRAENYSITDSKYFEDLHKIFDGIEEEVENSPVPFVKDGFMLVTDTQGRATTTAYFGDVLLEICPDIMSDLILFIQTGLRPMLFGLPKWFYPRAIKARTRLLQAFRSLTIILEQDLSQTSPFVAARITGTKALGHDTHLISKDHLGLLFGININSIPTAYVTLLQILSYPNLISELVHELETKGYGNLTPRDYTTLFPNNLPLLRSVFWECMRMHNMQPSVRTVLHPTTIHSDHGIYTLKPGAVVMIQPSLLHMNPAVNPSPHEFRPRRFMRKKEEEGGGGDGQSRSRSIKPFGGGNSYCPGRVFAEKQIMGFLAELIWRFDVAVVGEAGRVIEVDVPDNSSFEDVVWKPRVFLQLKRRVRRG